MERASSIGPMSFLAVAGLALAGCSRPPRPVPIVLNEESCSQCRMAVSQREFAAEAVDPGGAVHYFDDIGCLAAWVRAQKPPDTIGLFVVDYGNGAWLDARSAFYVRSTLVQTPMSYGLVAFGKRSDAAAAAERLQGQIVTWEELLLPSEPGEVGEP